MTNGVKCLFLHSGVSSGRAPVFYRLTSQDRRRDRKFTVDEYAVRNPMGTSSVLELIGDVVGSHRRYSSRVKCLLLSLRVFSTHLKRVEEVTTSSKLGSSRTEVSTLSLKLSYKTLLPIQVTERLLYHR